MKLKQVIIALPVVVALLVFLGPPVFRQLVRWVTAKPSPEEMALRAERAVIADNTANDSAVTLRRKVISEMRDSGVRLTGFGEDIVEFLFQERVTPEGAWQSVRPSVCRRLDNYRLYGFAAIRLTNSRTNRSETYRPCISRTQVAAPLMQKLKFAA